MVRARAEPSNLAFTTARARRVSDVLLRGAADAWGKKNKKNVGDLNRECLSDVLTVQPLPCGASCPYMTLFFDRGRIAADSNSPPRR